MYFNGAAHCRGAGAGVVFVTSLGEVLPYSFTLTQLCSNNVAEYQALILGLEMAVEMKRLQLQAFGYSQLVVNQLLGSYEVKKPKLCPYHDYAKKLMGWLGDVTIQHVPRKENKKIITDNGKTFDNRLMNKIYDLFGFKQRNSSMYNAAANGLAEAFNKTL
ncbi:uncharacterized protein [Nicotiana sylvestris]|uniref:uncharacterized protein n=1 Tax=Nicotiana sylvestris TaxID=4096 RepID=UPI00388C4F9D